MDIHYIVLRTFLLKYLRTEEKKKKGKLKCVYMDTYQRKEMWMVTLNFPGQMIWIRAQF